MTDREELVKSVGGVAAGYVFLHFNIQLGIVNLLPDWLGYAAIVHVLDVLGKEEPSANLLRPLGGILIAWEFIEIVTELIGLDVNLLVFGTIVTVINLYFHFQLLTNLAVIAEKYKYEKAGNIIRLRTVRMILITVFAVMPMSWERYSWLVTTFGIIGIIVGVWICIELNAFKKALLEDSANNESIG